MQNWENRGDPGQRQRTHVQTRRGTELEESAAEGHVSFWLDEHHVAISVRYAHHQYLGKEAGNLARRKIDDRQHLPTDQFGCLVALGQLGTRAAAADLRAEVDF